MKRAEQSGTVAYTAQLAKRRAPSSYGFDRQKYRIHFQPRLFAGRLLTDHFFAESRIFNFLHRESLLESSHIHRICAAREGAIGLGSQGSQGRITWDVETRICAVRVGEGTRVHQSLQDECG